MTDKATSHREELYQNELHMVSQHSQSAMVDIIVRDLISSANLLTDSHLVKLFAVITNEMSNRRGYDHPARN
jgi:hypothetical protein